MSFSHLYCAVRGPSGGFTRLSRVQGHSAAHSRCSRCPPIESGGMHKAVDRAFFPVQNSMEKGLALLVLEVKKTVLRLSPWQTRKRRLDDAYPTGAYSEQGSSSNVWLLLIPPCKRIRLLSRQNFRAVSGLVFCGATSTRVASPTVADTVVH
jgi:hypothetical protein